MKKFNKKDFAIFGIAIIISVYAISYQQQIQKENQIYFPRPLTDDDLKKYTNTDPKAIVIFPIFTETAYKNGGFYDYFKGTCHTCDTVSMRPLAINATYTTGLASFEYLMQLHYPFITDIMVDKHPEILADYDKIILLHNEYMTKKEFDAIKNHKNVIYLYPNAMYTEISVDYDKLTISLVKGHGYDSSKTPPYPINTGDAATNGFGYVTSSQHEYDFNCKNYQWEAKPNGIQPTCWPEFLIKSDRKLLQTITDYPQKIPILIPPVTNYVNVSKIGTCDYNGICK